MSKPQLIIQNLETAGIHNGGVGKVGTDLSRRVAWKRQRIVVIVPAGRFIASKVYLSHVNLQFPPNNGVVRALTLDTEVGEAYSTTINQILAHPELSKWEYILTLEHDNMPPMDGVLKLLERMEETKRKFACIGGLYFLKGHGGYAQIWGDPKDPILNFRPQQPDPAGGLVECNGTGMGFNLWQMSMFRDPKLRRPWFKTQKDGGGMATQDLYFWQDARKHGYRCAIDCSVKVGHYDVETDTIW